MYKHAKTYINILTRSQTCHIIILKKQRKGIYMKNSIFIDEQLLQQAEQILETIGLDASTVAKMALKRVIRDGGISFLVSDPLKGSPDSSTTNVLFPTHNEPGKITKNIAINLFKSKNFVTSRNTTFASKNKASNCYWANPLFESLKQDWYLILNDWQKNELHLFKIPVHALSENDLVCRADNEDKIDLQISYNDPSFTDTRSKISFAQFLISSISY